MEYLKFIEKSDKSVLRTYMATFEGTPCANLETVGINFIEKSVKSVLRTYMATFEGTPCANLETVEKLD